jgi:hypothetical protein
MKHWALSRWPKNNSNAQLLPAFATLLSHQTPPAAMTRAQGAQLQQKTKEYEAALKEKAGTIAALQRTSKASNSAKQLQLAAIVDLNKQLADSKKVVAEKDKKLAAAQAAQSCGRYLCEDKMQTRCIF